MAFKNEKNFDCSAFEEHLSEYLDKTLEMDLRRAVASHSLKCPVCHSLMNDVKKAIIACHQAAKPRPALSRLEARILERTMPENAIDCGEFEVHLTDYLDGFLPANVFHRWERHAVVCNDCSDIPGAVVRTLAVLVSAKLDELPVPADLHERIMQQTIGTQRADDPRATWSEIFSEWLRAIRLPIAVPQLAPVALMMMFAFLVVSQSVSADGSLTDVYSQSVRLAEQTYRQGADVLRGVATDRPPSQPANAAINESEGGK
jgi:predicted anti-sigma-YlaC factor YlaD